jgi:hypothetical protein
MTRRSVCAVVAGVCVLLGTVSASAQQTRPFIDPAVPHTGGPAPETGPTLQWLSVVLLMGSTAPGTADADDIPPAVQRALADVRAFLPFTSYQMYDAGLMGPPLRNRTTRLRLRGASSQQTLEATVSALGTGTGPVTRGPLSLNFALAEVDAPPAGREGGLSTRALMGNVVSLDVGETIVVGTSRIRGTGLIVLLTAVPATR